MNTLKKSDIFNDLRNVSGSCNLDIPLISYSDGMLFNKTERNSSIKTPKSSDVSSTIYNNIDEIIKHLTLTKKAEPPIKELSEQIISALLLLPYEDGNMLSAERLVFDISIEWGFSVLGQVVQDIISHNTSSEDIMIGLCESLERFDYDDVVPWGYPVMSTMILNKSPNVKEAGISLIENWATVEIKDVLVNTDFPEEWMASYVKKLITQLEMREHQCTMSGN